ncbi:MAG TPA: tetratricopeptide repeat protein, partial [Bacteroidota bacterium]|nr:tetratricopeptide repeat protein [Bacteroidota bacterium]
YRPGLRLQDIISLYFFENLPPEDLRVASHGERFAMSQCFKKSNGGLVCVSCHNPHQDVETVPRKAFNQICMNCHNPVALTQGKPRERHDKNGDCIACHMRHSTTVDVVHVNFTDHWIQKDPATRKAGVPGLATTLRDFFDGQSSEDSLRLNAAYLQMYSSSRSDRGGLNRVIASVEAGLQHDPDNEEALYRLAVSYSLQGRLKAAASTYRKLAHVNPRHALAHAQLATILAQLGQREEAVREYLAMLELVPEDATTRMALGTLYLQTNNQAAALECFEKACLSQPGFVPAHNALGEFYLYQKADHVTAQKYFLDALRLDPDFVPSLNNLGILDMGAGKNQEAADYFLRVLKLNPAFVQAYGNLGLVYSLQGRNAEALSVLRRGLEIDPDNGRIRDLIMKIDAAVKSQ